MFVSVRAVIRRLRPRKEFVLFFLGNSYRTTARRRINENNVFFFPLSRVQNVWASDRERLTTATGAPRVRGSRILRRSHACPYGLDVCMCIYIYIRW